MLIEDRRNQCNKKYVQILEMLQNNVEMKLVHDALVDLAEALFEFGKISPNDAARSNKKSIALIQIAKEMDASSKHDDVYFLLTGEHIINKTSIGFTEDDSSKINGDEDLVEKKKIKDVFSYKVKKKDIDNIRPETLDEYIGQDKIKKQLKDAISAAKIQGRPLEHILLFGSAGLGKTSLSKVIANEMNSKIIILSGPTIKDPFALVDILKDVREGDIVFIDEIHRMNQAAAEAIYTVMEDFELSYVEKTKDNTVARTIKLPPFTIIGATTHSGLLEKPMRDRFTIQYKLDMYDIDSLAIIATNTINKLDKTIDKDAAIEIAKRSRGIPRNCNSFTRRLYDKAVVSNCDNITKEMVIDFFDTSGIDENGLNELDLAYMSVIYKNFANRPVGIDNLAACLGEGRNIIENQVEPYLLYLGLIQITPSGRMLSAYGQRYIDKSSNNVTINDDSPKTVTAKFIIENAVYDDDLIPAAGMIYSNIEDNLIYMYKLDHEHKKFVIEENKYKEIIQDILNCDNHKYESELRWLLNLEPVVLFTNDQGNVVIECPPIIRFINVGLNYDKAILANYYWTINNKIRHKSPENENYLERELQKKNITRKQMLTEILQFFKEERLYTKD